MSTNGSAESNLPHLNTIANVLRFNHSQFEQGLTTWINLTLDTQLKSHCYADINRSVCVIILTGKEQREIFLLKKKIKNHTHAFTLPHTLSAIYNKCTGNGCFKTNLEDIPSYWCFQFTGEDHNSYKRCSKTHSSTQLSPEPWPLSHLDSTPFHLAEPLLNWTLKICLTLLKKMGDNFANCRNLCETPYNYIQLHVKVPFKHIYNNCLLC